MTILERFDVDRVSVEARDVDLGRAIATAIAGALYLLGWLAAKVVGVVWLAIAWSFAAVRLGWREARAGQAERRRPGPA